MSLERFADLMRAESWDEAAALVERNPELLEPASLDQIAAEADKGADDFTLAVLDDLLYRLRACVERGDLEPFRAADALPWPAVANRFLEQFMTAQGHYEGFQATAQLGEVDAAIRSWRDMRDDLDFPSSPVPFQLVVLDGLAASTMMRHLHSQDADALTRAIDVGTEALMRTPRGARLRARRLTNLASMLSARFTAWHDARDIGDAIAHAREAIELTHDAAPELAGRLNNLATALSLRHRQSADPRDVDETISVLRRAIEVAPSGARVLGQLHFNLGMALVQHSDDTADTALLDEAVDAFQQAAAAAARGDPERPMYLGELGRSVLRRWTAKHAAADLDRGIDALREGVELAPPGVPSTAEMQGGLGYALRDRFDLSGDDQDLYDALDAFSASFVATPLGAPELPRRGADVRVTLERVVERLGRSADSTADPEESAVLLARSGDLRLTLGTMLSATEALDAGVADLRRAADLDPSVERTLGLAGALYRRAGAIGDPAGFDEAVTVLETCRPVDEQEAAHVDGDLAVVLITRNQPGDLEEAIALLERSRTIAPPGPWRDHLTNALIKALDDHYGATNERRSLDRAVALVDEMRATQDPIAPGLAAELAETLLLKAMADGDAEAVSSAIDLSRASLSDSRPDDPDLAGCLNALGGALRARYAQTGDTAELNEAIAAYDRAHHLAPRDPGFMTNIGAALRARFAATGTPADLDAAIEHLRGAVELTPEKSPSLAVHLNNLAGGLQNRFDERGDPLDLDAALAAARDARMAASRGSPAFTAASFTLAEALRRHHELLHDERDLREAIAVLEEAAPSAPLGVAPMIAVALGQVLESALPEDAAEADLEAVSEHYRAACTGGLQLRLEAALAAAHAWGRWAAEREDWDEAAEAYGYGLEAIERGARAQLVRTDLETWLRKAQALPGAAAYAVARAGRPTEAAVIVEGGRGRILAQALELDRRDLERLPQLGHAELYRRYRNAAAAVERGEGGSGGPADPESHAFNKAARRTLDALVEEIRDVPGYADFLAAPGIEQLEQVSGLAPLVYLIATPAGGVALVVDGKPVATAVWLDQLDDAGIQDHLVPYLDAYVRRRRAPEDDAAWETWINALVEATGWLGRAALGPLADALGAPLDGDEGQEPKDVVIIATGPLGLLPLAGAWIAPRHYALDRLRIRSAPNARALLVGAGIAGAAADERLLLAWDPQPVAAEPLPHAATEAAAVGACWPASHTTELDGPSLTRDALEQTLADHSVLHFAGHAVADMLAPLRSGLLVADDELLTTADLADQRLTVRLAILSACETGVPGVALPDEVISLPTALVQAGTAGVVASMWPVADESTAKLMGAFHRGWRKERLEPAEALRRAQIELREGQYGHPYYWAAFTYTGT